MSTKIVALDRGGYSAHGEAWYDARANEVVIPARYNAGEEFPITALFGESVSSVTETEDGITGTTPTVSGSQFTATLSGVQSGDAITYLVTFTAGGKRRLKIVGGADPRADDYGS